MSRIKAELTKNEELLLEANLVWVFGSPETKLNLLCKQISTYHNHLLNQPQVCKDLGMMKVGLHSTRTFTEYRKDQDYFFSHQYSKTWMYYLKKLIINRIYSQFKDLTKKIIINEPQGAGASYIISEMFPKSRLLILLQDDKKEIDSFADQVMKNKKKLLVTSLNTELTKEEIYEIVTHRWMKIKEILMKAYNFKSKDLRYLIKYDNLKSIPQDEFKKIFKFLGINLNEEDIKKILAKSKI